MVLFLLQEVIPVRTISLKLPDPLARRLSLAVQRRRSTQSAVVRDALEAQLGDVGDTADQHSFLERARDLAGCLRGPADLSSSRRHLRGYGR